ncbi:hypothetical protein TNIN_235981 [Trichonephila inaurata madagascariensis]|uniref:Uncharacterized protein n=1 Tax=Trichonephila inaurata madagascariensis TaxID=2747483 RepID=A0A8X6XYW1_9ARAC|nr:hypothetical protein TNIN_235981 [Trichonephila inaurata madagascariensis]
MCPIWTSRNVNLLLLRLSSGSWRPCLDCRRCLKWYGHDLLNCPSRDPPCAVLPEDQEPAFLVISLLFLRWYGQDPS